MQLVRRFRLPAIFCALAVLFCALISRPYANMGVADDGLSILAARHLANTGQVVYYGWSAPMLGWQLYLGAAFIRLFGFSFTVVRMSGLLVASALAWLLQRTLVLAGVDERNATLGTLTMVLSPLYLTLSPTFMSDIFGLFAVVTCLYGCLRALRATAGPAVTGWLWFAVIANAIFGTARQIAWLGILVMVPSALYLLGSRDLLNSRGLSDSRRRILLAGVASMLAGAVFVLACMQWLEHQPYSIPERVMIPALPVAHTLAAIAYVFADMPLLLLPLIAAFILEVGKLGRVRTRILLVLAASSVAYLLLALHWSHLHPNLLLEPTLHDWTDSQSLYARGDLPILQAGVTAICVVGALGLLACLLRPTAGGGSGAGPEGLLWPSPASRSLQSGQEVPSLAPGQLGVLLLPFVLAYTLLLVPRAASQVIWDRYALDLLPFAALFLLRFYQRYVQPQLPLLTWAFVALTAACGIVETHNNFALHHARAAVAAELRAAGIPDNRVENGWEYNFVTEVRYSSHLNDPLIVMPPGAYQPRPPIPAGSCSPAWEYERTPHIRPIYGVSFHPNACYGLAPFAPVRFSRWPYRTPGTLYVVHYLPPTKP